MSRNTVFLEVSNVYFSFPWEFSCYNHGDVTCQWRQSGYEEQCEGFFHGSE